MSELIEDKYRKWEMLCEERFRRLKENEEKLNRFYIDLYDISEEITPDVDDSDVTVCRADLKRDIKSLLSYAGPFSHSPILDSGRRASAARGWFRDFMSPHILYHTFFGCQVSLA